jgi:gliding motility-associated-like protein
VTVEFSVVAIPSGDTLLTFCEVDPIPLASVQSSSSPITWYSDESLTSVVATGLSYQSSLENDTLYVTATSGACESEALEIIIQQIGLLTAEIITPSDTSLCSGQPIELTSTANNQNSWNTGSTASSITVTSAGTYTLTRTGQCNTATDQIIITGIPVTANLTTDVDSGYVILPVNVTDQSVNGETYSWTLNGEPITFTAPGTLTFPDSGTFVLELVVSNSTGCYDSDSAVIKVLSDKLLLVVPNVFTPNSDGFNDLFQVKYNAVKTFQARVFNRWGKQLYSWENVSAGWDGLHNTEKVPDGTYFFIISGTDIKDQPFEEKGTVTLLGN